MLLYLQFTTKSYEGIPVINSSFKEQALSGHLAPSSWWYQAAAVNFSSSSHQSAMSQGWHKDRETIMLPREPPESFYWGSVPHEPHVKMELLDALKICSNLIVAEMANCLLKVCVPPVMLLTSGCPDKDCISQHPLASQWGPVTN